MFGFDVHFTHTSSAPKYHMQGRGRGSPLASWSFGGGGESGTVILWIECVQYD
jgi:hypothetical protein